MQPETSNNQHASRLRAVLAGRKRRILLTAGGLLLIIISLAAFKLAGILSGPVVAVPPAIQSAIQFPIYVPTRFPGTYKLDDGSLTLANNVLIFEAKDGVSAPLAFTQQSRPAGFDFASFYSSNLQDSQLIQDTPYPSVWGKTLGERITLSIVTDETWLLMTTTAPLSPEDIATLARSVRKN